MAVLRITARNFLKVFLGNTFKKFLAWGLSTKLGHKPKRIIGGALRRQLFFWVKATYCQVWRNALTT